MKRTKPKARMAESANGKPSTLHLVDELNRQINIAWAVKAATCGLTEVITPKAVSGVLFVLDAHIESLQAISEELHPTGFLPPRQRRTRLAKAVRS